MGAAYSADDYSAWEKTYVTEDHNGSTACSRMVPIKPEQGAYDNLSLEHDSDVKLLYVHGVWNVGSLRLKWETATIAPGKITFNKKPMGDMPGGLLVELDVPIGSNELDLSEYRALFVAYMDTLTKLSMTVTLPGVAESLILSSVLVPDPPNGQIQAHGVTIGPDGAVQPEEQTAPATSEGLRAMISRFIGRAGPACESPGDSYG